MGKKVGMPSVINMAIFSKSDTGRPDHTREDDPVTECFVKLREAGADVVGLNCFRGPKTTLPLLQKARREGFEGDLAGLPMVYRTNEDFPTHWCLQGDDPNHFPHMEEHLADRNQMAKFALDCADINVNFVGTCCGGGPHHVRAMAEALGRRVPASDFSPDIRKHTFLGTDDRLSQKNRIVS